MVTEERGTSQCKGHFLVYLYYSQSGLCTFPLAVETEFHTKLLSHSSLLPCSCPLSQTGSLRHDSFFSLFFPLVPRQSVRADHRGFGHLDVDIWRECSVKIDGVTLRYRLLW